MNNSAVCGSARAVFVVVVVVVLRSAESDLKNKVPDLYLFSRLL